MKGTDRKVKVSVIVPIYNVGTYLENGIKSLINQSYHNIEIILINDGSTDDSGDICEAYAKRDCRITVIHQKNGGVVSARKAGCHAATGEYVASVDGDDWLEENYIENFVKAATESGADVIWSISYYKEHKDRTELYISDAYRMLASDRKQRELLGFVNGMQGFQNEIDYSICNKLIRKDLYTEAQDAVDEHLTRGEDLFFSLLLLTKTDHIYFVRNDGYHYEQRESSNTHNRQGYSDEKYRALQKNLYEFSDGLSKEKLSLVNIVDGYIMSTYMLYFFGTRQETENEYLYPFYQVRKHSRVVVYGAGSIGQSIVSYLNETHYYEMCAWVDGTETEHSIGTWKVQPPKQLIGIEFDYVILATNKTGYIREMKESLYGYGIADEKIVSVYDSKIPFL